MEKFSKANHLGMTENNKNISIIIKNNKTSYKGIIYDVKEIISTCKICVSKNTWTITSWYTSSQFQHEGYGSEILKQTVLYIYEKHNIPDSIEYVWNGENQYVMDWLLRHFDPISKLPISVMKYQEADDWEAHVYKLNKNKILEYCGILSNG